MSRALRDSGVGWLGAVPASWKIVPARALFSERKERSAPEDVHLTPSQRFGVLPQAEYMEVTGSKVVLNLTSPDNMRRVESGDYISHLRSFQGGLEYSTLSGKVSAAYTVLKPRSKVAPRYFKYLFKSDLYVQALQTTTDQLRDGQSIRFVQFATIPLPAPSVAEQSAIADYLDRETAQIDAFIAKNEELIRLLRERESAQIERTVNSAARIGWRSLTIRRLGVRNESGVSVNGESTPATEDEIGVLKTGATSKGFFDPMENKRVVPEDLGRVRTPVRAHTLIVNRANTPELVGSAAFVETAHPNLYLSDKLWQLTFTEADPEYMYFWTRSAGYRDQLRTLSVGSSSSMQNLSFEDFLGLRLTLPPIDEQPAIAKRMKEATERLQRTISTAHRAIELARERRAALISAAVTGKIDVGEAA